MTDLVYEVGYQNVTLAKLLKRAAISKPTYYELFDSKEDCFLAALAEVAGGAIGRMWGATAGCATRWEVVHRASDAFCRSSADRPWTANLGLIEPMTVGGEARKRMHRSEEEFALLLRTRLSQLAEPIVLPRAVASGMVSGVARVVRRRLDDHEANRLRDDADELANWATAVSDIESLDRFLLGGANRIANRRRAASKPAIPASDERARLVNAAMELLSERGYPNIEVSEIVRAAGLRRRSFDAHFVDLDSCFLAVCELGCVAAVSEIRTAYREGAGKAPGVVRALSALTRYLAASPAMSRLLFLDVLLPKRQVTREGAEMLSIFAKLLSEHLPDDMLRSQQGAEAAVGAVWGLIRGEIESGRLRSLPRLSPLLSWFVLAPSWE